MNNKSLPLIIGVVVILLVGGFVYWQTSQTSTPATQQTGTTDTQTASTTASQSYTMTDVAAHKDATSCWTVIDGSVYDLTQWVTQHPGGERAILSICGIDGSSAFHGQHGNNPRQENILATFKIGVLAQ